MAAWQGLLIVAVCGQVPPPRSVAVIGTELRADLKATLDRERAQLEALAAKLAADGRAGEAEAVRRLIEPEPEPNAPNTFKPLPDPVVPGEGEIAPPPEAAAIRTRSSKALFALYQRAIAPGSERIGVATESLRAAFRRNSLDPEINRLLGYVPHDGGWATPQTAANLKNHMVRHPRFGWVEESWVPHLDRGELPAVPVPGQPLAWLPADEADRQRRDFAKRPWLITTAHFEIAANVPLEEVISFGQRLEALHELFWVLLPDLYDPKSVPIVQRARDPMRQAGLTTKRHQVWYFASKDEYVEYFRKSYRIDVEGTLGYAMPPSEARSYRQKPRSYFYRPPPDDAIAATETLFHEASHQLVFESGPSNAFTSNLGQFWVWEGLGTYFETLRPMADGSYQFGGFVGPRLAKARADLVDADGFVDLTALLAMGRAHFQAAEVASDHYAEGMALVVFLLHGQGGRYREGFLEYLAEAYRGRFRPGGGGEPLPDRLGTSAQSLDQEFRRFVTEAVPRP